MRRLRLLDLSLEPQKARVPAEASQRQEQEAEVDAEHSTSLLQQVSVREIVLSSETTSLILAHMLLEAVSGDPSPLPSLRHMAIDSSWEMKESYCLR